MKIVIITQRIYPELSPRSHRSTQLAIELAKRGFDVTLYALLGNYDYTDFSEQTKIKIKSLGKSKFGLVNSQGELNNNLLNKILAKLFRKFILYPDIELFPKVRSVLREEGEIDLLITIAVPFIIHFATTFSSLEKVKCWISDCGDPFMGNKFYSYPFYFKFIEKKWSFKTDFITVPIESAKDAYYQEYRHKIKVIPQGFDFTNVRLAEYVKNEIPTFAYSGTVYKQLRDPENFLKYLSTVDYDFKFIVYTKSINIFLPYKEILKEKLEIRNYIPRDRLIYELSKMDFLINIENKSSVQNPSKLIDYSLINRPCINISSEFKEKEIFEEFISGDYKHRIYYDNVEQYNIINVTDKFLYLYNEKVNNLRLESLK